MERADASRIKVGDYVYPEFVPYTDARCRVVAVLPWCPCCGATDGWFVVARVPSDYDIGDWPGPRQQFVDEYDFCFDTEEERRIVDARGPWEPRVTHPNPPGAGGLDL